jgi:hypothetical protein
MYIKYSEHEWVVLMSRKSVDRIFPTNILTSYDALVSTQQTITEEKQKQSVVRMHFIYLHRTKNILLKNMLQSVTGVIMVKTTKLLGRIF